MPIKSILIIEDDRFIGEMYVRSLRKDGYDVDWMVDGSDGLVAARNKVYDLLIIDIMLPEKQGTEILDELRGGPVDLIPNSRVIVFTNFEQDEEAREVTEKHADGYLIKAEVTPRKLIEAIQQLDKLPQR